MDLKKHTSTSQLQVDHRCTFGTVACYGKFPWKASFEKSQKTSRACTPLYMGIELLLVCSKFRLFHAIGLHFLQHDDPDVSNNKPFAG